MTAWGRPVERAQHVLWWATQAQIADHAHVVPAFGKTEKHCLKVGQNTTAIRHRYDHNTTKYPDEWSEARPPCPTVCDLAMIPFTPLAGVTTSGAAADDQDQHHLLMKPMNPVAVSPVGSLWYVDHSHLLPNRCQPAVTANSQRRQTIEPLALEFGYSRIHFSRNHIHPNAGATEDT